MMESWRRRFFSSSGSCPRYSSSRRCKQRSMMAHLFSTTSSVIDTARFVDVGKNLAPFLVEAPVVGINEILEFRTARLVRAENARSRRDDLGAHDCRGCTKINQIDVPAGNHCEPFGEFPAPYGLQGRRCQDSEIDIAVGAFRGCTPAAEPVSGEQSRDTLLQFGNQATEKLCLAWF